MSGRTPSRPDAQTQSFDLDLEHRGATLEILPAAACAVKAQAICEPPRLMRENRASRRSARANRNLCT